MSKNYNKWLKSKKRGWGDVADLFNALRKDLKATPEHTKAKDNKGSN